MKTLNGYKLEKALIGVVDKGRGREPGYEFGFPFHLMRLQQELDELIEAIDIIRTTDDSPEAYEKAMKEVADLSNFCDFIADRLLKQYVESRICAELRREPE